MPPEAASRERTGRLPDLMRRDGGLPGVQRPKAGPWDRLVSKVEGIAVRFVFSVFLLSCVGLFCL